MIRILFNFLRDILIKLKKAYELRKYDDFTISAYFRKQGAIIGENNRIMIKSLGDNPYLVRIGNHCSISTGVNFITHDGGGWIFTEEIPSLQKFGEIEVKDNCFIGQNCIILPNVIIGPNSVVGAGSVITKDVSPNTVVAGNPARVIKTIDEYKDGLMKIWMQQRPPNYFADIKSGAIYSPKEIQKMKYRDAYLLKEHLLKVFSR